MPTQHHFVCRHCGRGFRAVAWSKNGTTNTCKRAKCEKLSFIYEKTKKD